MGYAKVITYGNNLEIYQYEESPKGTGRRPRKPEGTDRVSDLPVYRASQQEKQERQQAKRKDNARRAGMAFRRLVSANLSESDVPVLFSFTYAENITDPARARKDFNSFARAIRSQLKNEIRYICVAEFQKRGVIHLHALFWGIPDVLVERERSTRFFATLWKQGFIDLVKTDGNERISGYLSKYMSKSFADSRMYLKKAYISSQNCLRPKVDKNAIVLSYMYEYELSTATPLRDREYLTQWLGECRYRLYKLT